MSRSATDWDTSARGGVEESEDDSPYGYLPASWKRESGGPVVPTPPRTVRRSGSRLAPGLMLATAYGFAYWGLTMGSTGPAMPAGYQQMLVLVGVPFLLAAHGFAVVRWNQLRRFDEVHGTVRDVTTDVSLSVWEILFCWLGISASLMFLYYAAPITELKDWYPRFFLVLVVFFGATCQKSLVFVFALLPFVMTLTALSLWVYGMHDSWALGANADTAVAAGLLVTDLAVLWWAARLARRHGGFRVCEFQMPLGAGFAGGYLSGVIRTRQKTMPAAGFHLQLSCLQLYKEGAKRRQGQVLWHAQKTVRGDQPGARHTDTSIPVIFEIPGEAPASTGDADNRVVWTLRATAALPETDFRCLFEVPVRPGNAENPMQPPLQLLNAPGAQAPDPLPPLREGSEGIGFHFKAPWNRAIELATVGYFVFWFQLIWLATSHAIGWETWGMFGVGLWILAWAMAPWTSSTELTVLDREGGVKIVNRRFVLKKSVIVPSGAFEGVAVKLSSLRTGLMEGLDFYHVELRRSKGKPLVAARHLRDRWQAGMVARAIKKLMDKPG